MPVTRDPKHPDFPHGTTRGYRRGCRTVDTCPGTTHDPNNTCRTAWLERGRQQRARTAAGIKVRGRDASDVHAHATQLLEQVPEAAWITITKAADVPADLFIRIRETNTVTYPVAAKILALTPGDLYDHLGLVDADEVRHMLNTLQALGYPIRWIERRSKLGNNVLMNLVTDTGADTLRVRVATFNKVLDVYRSVAGRPAEPNRDSIPQRVISRAQSGAAARGVYSPDSTNATTIISHCNRLLKQVPGAARSHLAKLANVPVDTIDRMYSTNHVDTAIARTLLAARTTDLADQLGWLDVTEARHMVGTMRACGYPTDWIAEHCGLSRGGLSKLMSPTVQLVRRTTHDRITALFNQIDGTLADPDRDNLSPVAIRHTKVLATRAGYYPPACYNDDGTLNPRAIPDHPWAQADDRCAKLMELAHDLATTGSRAEAIRAAGGSPGDEGRATRIIRRLGITFTYEVIDETSEKVSRFVYEPHEARQINRDIFDRIETIWETYAAGTTGPVYAALTLGLVEVTSRGNGALPVDHPELIAWRAEQAAEDELDQVPQAA